MGALDADSEPLPTQTTGLIVIKKVCPLFSFVLRYRWLIKTTTVLPKDVHRLNVSKCNASVRISNGKETARQYPGNNLDN